ncbi:MAG: cytochrome d ubiquinol oxidase subunit II [Flavisolibacter sp.]|nr:cytochrome d ubiquinol oxidase subunit II [Flavisolibacter sp.]
MRPASFIFVLALLSAVSGYLLSRASLVGRVGIRLYYQQYKFLKVWWQGALVVFGIFLVLYFILSWVHRKKSSALLITAMLILFGAIAGLFFTYQDFRNDLSHRFLGERFHLGAYLFWVGCMLISLYFLFIKRRGKA